MSIFRVSINIATASHSLEQLNEYTGVAADRWLPIGDPVHDFDPATNPAAQLKQLWFGAGAHYCLGAPLAMAQIRLTLGALLENPTLRVASRRPSRGVLIPSYARLELERA